MANLVAQIVIIITGGLVRLTGSGLGCSTWPLCEPGSFTPEFHEATSIHPYIEFGNRTLSGVLTLIGIAVVILVTTDRTRSSAYRKLGWIPLIGVLAQAVIGGLTVLVKLNPAVVGFHLMISMLLVAASAYLVARQRESDGPPRACVNRRATIATVAYAGWLLPVLVLGVLVTGSGPHSGDDVHGYRFALDPAAMARVHAASVWVLIGVLAVATWFIVRSADRTAPRRAVAAVWGIVVVQGIVGYVQFFAGLPVALVAIHMALAGLLTAASVFLLTSLRVRS